MAIRDAQSFRRYRHFQGDLADVEFGGLRLSYAFERAQGKQAVDCIAHPHRIRPHRRSMPRSFATKFVVSMTANGVSQLVRPLATSMWWDSQEVANADPAAS